MRVRKERHDLQTAALQRAVPIRIEETSLGSCDKTDERPTQQQRAARLTPRTEEKVGRDTGSDFSRSSSTWWYWSNKLWQDAHRLGRWLGLDIRGGGVTTAGGASGFGDPVEALLACFLLLLDEYFSHACDGSGTTGAGVLVMVGDVPNVVGGSNSPADLPEPTGVDSHVHFVSFTTPRPIVSNVVPSDHGASPVNMWYSVAPNPHTSTFSLARHDPCGVLKTHTEPYHSEASVCLQAVEKRRQNEYKLAHSFGEPLSLDETEECRASRGF